MATIIHVTLHQRLLINVYLPSTTLALKGTT